MHQLRTPPGDAVSAFQLQEAAVEEHRKHPHGVGQPLDARSPVFPFGTPADVARINGTGYLTAQTLVQQVAYTLSDRLFTYSPASFCLDDAVKEWSARGQANARGRTTTVDPMESRLGAANVLLGYVFSADSNAQKKHIAQSIIASSATLTLMRSALDQLAMLYSMSSPFVAHVVAADYDAATGKLVTDYVAPITVAQETGTGLVASFSSHEAQHMALFATLASTVLPTIHVYDGVRLARESAKVTDILDQTGLQNVFASITSEQSEKADDCTKVTRILKSLNAELGTGYQPFEYEGHPEPTAVLVVFGSVESSLATQVVVNLVKAQEKVGVIAVRVYRPFAEEQFAEVLPKSVNRIVVLGQVWDELAVDDRTVRSALYTDILAAVTMSGAWDLSPPIVDVKYAREHVWTPKEFAWIFEQAVRQSSVSISIPAEALTSEASTIDSFDLLAEEKDARQYVFWDSDEAASTPAAAVVARVLADDSAKNISFSAVHDNVAIAGTLHSQIRTSQRPVDAPFYVEGADVSFVGDLKLLEKFDVAARTLPGRAVIVKTDVKPEDIEAKLPAPFRRGLVKNDLSLFLLNPSTVAEAEASAIAENALVQLAFLRTAGIDANLDRLSALNRSSEAVQKAATAIESALVKVEIPKEWAEAASESEPTLSAAPAVTSFALNAEKNIEEPTPLLSNWQAAAKALAFKEAFGVKTALRPDLTAKTHIVKVKENRRLTPTTYDRNIFHIEFDLGGTDLTYQIGEALGIHAQNDADDVQEFINWYGLQATDLVEVPSRENPDVLEVRTVFQALQQNVDIFGRPPKKFYEALSEYTEDEDEKKGLLALASPDGAVEFKRRAEVDTVTYADILQENPSARPAFQDLVRIVAPLKRREYSIASAQVVNPDSVHLMIVVVNWTDPKGRDRFGQATRYLSRLPVGAEVVVSVKPSVMKLPPQSTQPLIMAGLGTGLAPFRAFVQYRAWQAAQGKPIGPVLLYMGSRTQREEYLYGEEWEAYQAAGIITLLGRAFSRDQKEKIYIQDRMRQTLTDIGDAYVGKEGSFYLCGPTWPVPDVAQVLKEAIEDQSLRAGVTKKVDGRKRIEELKEEGRYVLEVY